MNIGLIGHPLGHSYSKIMQEQWVDCEYHLWDIAPEDVGEFMTKKQFDGINVTIPHKMAVIPYLDDIDETALKVGAVNTIVHRNNRLIGYNTDVFGLTWLLQENNISITNKKVAILGNGGATKAALVVASNLGCKQCLIVSRKKGDGVITMDELMQEHNDVEVFIQATPVGMMPHEDQQLFSLASFHKAEAFVDLIYNPYRTTMVIEALDLGLKAIGGLQMLVAQGQEAIKRFHNITLSDDEIRSMVSALRCEKQNVVLIGMPGCGKSTVGKMFAEYCQREWVDCDQLIEQRCKKSIAEIFKDEGEEAFRNIESEVITMLSKRQGIVISCGGGVIKRHENTVRLRRNGFIVYLKRDLNELEVGVSRPLSQHKGVLEEMYKQRHPLYEKMMDVCIENNQCLQTVVENIEREWKKR